ncbi:hypothetical protein [Lutibacter sp.]
MKKILLILSFIVVILISCEEIFYEDDISKDTIGLIAPNDNAIFDIQKVLLNWRSIEGAEQYQLQIVSPSFLNSSRLVKDTILTTTTYEIELAPNEYQWRVKGINSAYETAYSTNSFEIITLNPEDIIELLSPDNELITNQTEQLLKWSVIDYAEKYTIQIWNPNTSGTLVQELEVETTEATVNFGEGNFVWQVNAINNDKSTAYTSRSLLVDSTVPNTPQLENPVDLLETLNSTINFSWQREAIEGSIEMDSLFVYKDIALTHAIFKDNVTTSEIQLVLEPNTYYWFVKSYDQAGNKSESSTVNSFMILEGIENNTVELIVPEDALITNNSTHLFQWNPIENADEYSIQVLQNDGTNTVIFDITTTQTEKEITLQDGAYLWQVKAMNEYSETAFSERTILIDTQTPNTPELIAPVNEHTQLEKIIHFEYSRILNEGSTEIDSLFVYADENLTGLTLKAEVINNNHYQEFEVSTYYWYVKSYDKAGNESNQSEVRLFTIEANFSESEVELITPQDELITNNAQQTFEWSPITGAIDYRMLIHTVNNSALILQDFTLPITTKTVTFEDGYYTWKVRAQNESQNTVYTSRNILVDTTAPEKATLTNPADQEITNNTTVQFIWSLEENIGSEELSTISVYKDATLNDLLFSEELSETSLYKDITPGTYYWYIEVFDVAGNSSGQSDVFSFTIE